MAERKHLTGLDVARHAYGDDPLLDLSSPGLRLVALRTLKDGRRRGSWIYRYRTSSGQLRQLKLGQYPAMTLADAREAWRAQKRIRDDPSRGDPRGELERRKTEQRAEEGASRQARYLVRDLCENYLAEHVEKVRKRIDEPRRMLEREVLPTLGERSAVGIVRRDVHDIVQGIIDRGANRVAAMLRTELRAAYEHAINAGRLPEDHPNPCEKVRAPPQRKRERALSDAELKEFISWLPNSRMSRSVRDAMLFELMTTARQGEIVAMQWRHVDMERLVWHQPTSKNRRPHDVMLSSQAAQVLQRRRGLHEVWVFPRPDGRGHIASKAIGIQQYAAKSGLSFSDWTVHDLRRTALTGLARLGCSRVVQDRIANHFDKSIAAVYDRHRYDEEAREWLQRWADYLDTLKPASDNNATAGVTEPAEHK